MRTQHNLAIAGLFLWGLVLGLFATRTLDAILGNGQIENIYWYSFGALLALFMALAQCVVLWIKSGGRS